MTGIGSQLSNSSCQILRAYSNFQAHIRMYIRISDCIANSYTDHYDKYMIGLSHASILHTKVQHTCMPFLYP